ncbi:fibronectin type III domain-containing protein 5 isoform X2 [Terrapene carolina triunguis]|uniref:fibronectin type III domain-containing protein 5 isoform X2 n=1 Tax=Terrapene triunguis TaxID=2587831 RepID=UPI000CEF5F61|nr:fibronectin type III domain-containing protein 5 isoform X2 [Terrapene carolina triunguis]
MHPLWRMDHVFIYINAALLFYFSYASLFLVEADSPSAPVNVTVKHLKANSAVVTWDVLEDEVVIGFAISQQKKDVRMLRFIQEVNTTTRSCALWDLEEDTEYIVHVQSISIQGQSPASEPVLFKTPREAEKLASKNKDEVTMKEMGKNQQLRAGEILIIVVVLFMWAGSMTSSKITNQITTRRKPRVRLRAALRSTRAEGSCAASFQKTSLQ